MLSETARILRIPPAKWAQEAEALTANGADKYAGQLEAVAQNAAMLAIYLRRRADGADHAAAAKAARRRLVKIRQAMGFSYPDAGAFSF